MSAIKAGDYVGRKSYGMDIVFNVKRIEETESRGAKTGTAIALLRAFGETYSPEPCARLRKWR